MWLTGKVSPGRGSDGFSPTITVTDVEGGHQIEIVDRNGTQIFTVLNGERGPQGLTGPQGERGLKGDKGDTPKRGVDYWTNVDQQIVITQAKQALIDSNGYVSKGTGSHSNIENDLTNNQASGSYTHAEGYHTIAAGDYSHAEGESTTAFTQSSHAEGCHTTASASYAHAEGYYTNASGGSSHAEGIETNAYGRASHAEGIGTGANADAQHVFGTYNTIDTGSIDYETGRRKYIEMVGNGLDDDNRSDARRLDWNGNEELAGSLTLGVGTADEVTITPAQLKALLALLGD